MPKKNPTPRPSNPEQQHTLQLAEILSDLTTLRLCDPTAALALVSARPSTSSQANRTTENHGNEDPDLKRARDLVELHYAVKVAHRRGELGRKLHEAREVVARAVG